MKLGKKLLGALALLTLFANSFADEVFNITVGDGNVETFTTQPSAGATQGAIKFPAGKTTTVTIPLNPGQPQNVPLSLTVDGYAGVVITPDGKSVNIIPGVNQNPLMSLVSAKIDDKGEVDVNISSPSSNITATYNVIVNLGNGMIINMNDTKITGGIGGNSGQKISNLSGATTFSVGYGAAIGFNATFYPNSGANSSYTIPYIPNSSIIIDKDGNYNLNFATL